MPDQKLSQLTAAASVAGSDQLYIVQGGQSKRATAAQLPISTATAAALADKEATGTAATAVAAHLAAADPHPTYLTPTEANTLYAPLASVHDPVTLGATVADVLGLTGQQLTADDPGASADRLLFWDHSAGRLRYLTLGSGLTITDTTIDAAGGTGGYPAFAAPTGFTVTGSGTASITLAFAAGYSLPTTASQASWDTAYNERLRWDGGSTGLNAITARASLGLGGAATLSVGTTAGTVAAGDDSRITGALSAATAATTYQPLDSDLTAIAALSTTAFGRSLLALADAAAGRTTLGLGTAATTASTDYAAASHTQAASTITGLASVATTGAYSDLSGSPTIPAAADAAPLAPAAAASIGTSTDYAREDHVHPLPAVVSTTAAGLAPATSFAALTYAATTDLDMAALDGQYRTITLTGDLTLTTSNRAAGRVAVIRLLPGASQRTLTFPVGWVFVGTKPATLAASKTAVLSLTFFGTADTDCVAAYAVQS